MGLLDIDIKCKEPITQEYLKSVGFQKRRDGSWEYNIRFKTDTIWVIRYFPRGTYNGVRLRNSRLVFKDINYRKYEKKQHKHTPIDINKDYRDCPRVPQIVIKNPGKTDIDMFKYHADNNCKLYTEYYTACEIHYNSKKTKLSYEKWLKDHSNI